MDILISLAKIILAILPFLARKSKIKGSWIARFQKQDTVDMVDELVEAKQLWSLVWGKIRPLNNPNDPPWQFFGLMREQVFVGIYFAKEKLQHWQGSFTLKLDTDENGLTGVYSGFEEETQEIIGSKYIWKRK